MTVSNIAKVSRGKLLCSTYELLLEQIKQAEKSQGEKRKAHLAKGIQVLQTLVSDLNFKASLSKELFRIYVYVQGLLVQAKSNDQITEAYELIDKVYKGFKKVVENEEERRSSIQNTEKVHASLTYGKENIIETTLYDPDRGFKV